MISLEHINAAYQTKAGTLPVLSNIDIQVPEGETCALIGPSGCGKSTLLKIAAGILTNVQGSVFFRGEPLDPAKHVIGFMPQNYGLLPWRRVRDNILLGWRIKRGNDTKDRFVWQELISRLGLEKLLDRYPGELSGGQQQRVGLARVFYLRPDLLLMDEPFSALDAITREEMQDVFLELWRVYGVTTLLVTHQPEEAVLLGQRITVLSPRPASVVKIIDNPLFAQPDMRRQPSFLTVENELRQALLSARNSA